MKDMPKYPRLIKRGNTFWHRAVTPVDIRSSYPKTEETFSLGTKDPREAIILLHRAAAEVDERFAAHRREQMRLAGPAVADLTKAQVARIEELYFSHLLDEDECVRLDGFFDHEEPLPSGPVPTFDEYAADSGGFSDDARFMLARGKGDDFYRSEAEEVLSWDGLVIKLDERSPSWKLAVRAIQSAIVRAGEAITARNSGDVVATPEVAIAPAPRVAQSSSPLASVVRSDWIAEKSTSAWVQKTRNEHSVWSQHFLDLVGDRPIGDYSKADGRAFKLALQRLPPNWNKQKPLKELSFAQAAQKAAELGLEPMSDKNINKIIGFIAAFWNWAAENYDEVKGNPLDKLKVKIKGNARDDRDVFNVQQLTSIFTAPLYTGCQSAQSWSEPGAAMQNDSGRYWVPLISLFSGARLGEIIQLRTDDVRDDSGVLHFALVDEGEDQRLKTYSSRRRIPVHPELVALGFLKLVERRRASGERRLFPDLPMGEDGYYSSPFSKFFGRFLVTVGAKGQKTTFHSFRHTFEDACRDAEMPTEIMNTLQGHSEKGMAARYGKGYVLPKLDEWMRRIKYDGLDLGHLRG
ncbi:MAG: DUF6538 domain-containing protein [Pseudomonas sp.]